MKIQIQARGFTLTPGLINHIEKRVLQSIEHIGGDIRKIAVRLSDINGPRRGSDKRCIVQISLRGRKGIVVEDIHGDMYMAITHAALRAAHSTKKLLGRQRAFWRTARPSDLKASAEPPASWQSVAA